MKEQSQIDEMRAALRGDRERAERARQRTAENVLQPAETPEVTPPRDEQPVGRARGFLSRLLGR